MTEAKVNPVEETEYGNLLRTTKAFYGGDLGEYAFDPAVLELLGENDAINGKLLPLSFTNGCLTLVTSNLENFSSQVNILSALQNSSHHGIKAIKLLYCDGENLQKGFKKAYAKNLPYIPADTNLGNKATSIITRQTEQVEKILDYGIAENASDIHITPCKAGAIIQYRIDGRLHRGDFNITVRDRSYIINIIKAMAKLDPANKLVPQDGAFVFHGIELRVNTYPTVYDEKVNMRILNGNAQLLRLADMHFPIREETLLKEIVQKPYGIILMTGPTGQGKSTTLYACMRERSTEENVILSAEDPVEQRIEGAAQAAMKPLQDNEAVSFTFAKALRASLRQDPDIIFVGEIRDMETGVTAVQASQTGHLLFATLHCRSAIHSVQRIVDMGIDRNSFLGEMACIISQRLVAKTCPFCRKKIISPLNEKLSDRDLAVLEEGKYSYEAAGCPKCNYQGILGRVPVIEILTFDNELRDYFSVQRGLVETGIFLRRKGFRTMWSMGMDYVAKGDISLKELLATLVPDDEIKEKVEIIQR